MCTLLKMAVRAMVRRHLLLLGGVVVPLLLGLPAKAEIRIATAGPMTGAYAWFGEQYQRAAELAVEDLNAKGGVLGQRLELIVGDDFCDKEQAVALARKLASDGTVLVVGHFCSHSSIAAAEVYKEAGILQISPGSVSGKLTEGGIANVFRVCGRDDQQALKVADHLAEHWAGKRIAILDDGTTFGAGLANAVRGRLQILGIPVAVNQTFTPGESNYSALVNEMQVGGVEVFFVGALHQETALIFRQAQEQGLNVQLIAPSSSATGDFPIIAGPAIEGTLMVAATDARENATAADVMVRFRQQGYEPVGFTLYAYAAVQAWAEAVESAGSLDLAKTVQVMRSGEFETVLGRIGFDEKGDVTGFDPWQWYVWQADGTYLPAEVSSIRSP